MTRSFKCMGERFLDEKLMQLGTESCIHVDGLMSLDFCVYLYAVFVGDFEIHTLLSKL